MWLRISAALASPVCFHTLRPSRSSTTTVGTAETSPKGPVEAISDGFADGRDRALDETGLPDAAMPAVCPYTFDEMMTREIVYDAPSRA